MENCNFITCAFTTLLGITLLQHKELHAKTKYKDVNKMSFRISYFGMQVFLFGDFCYCCKHMHNTCSGFWFGWR